jgi:uncharacterized protein YlzI (FlbEa/FlbD family)
MIHKTNNINEIVNLLINGEDVVVRDEHKKEVQRRLREIKNNCTIVLSQFKNL